MAVRTIRIVSCSSACRPRWYPPTPTSDTSSPVRPSGRYGIPLRTAPAAVAALAPAIPPMVCQLLDRSLVAPRSHAACQEPVRQRAPQVPEPERLGPPAPPRVRGQAEASSAEGWAQLHAPRQTTDAEPDLGLRRFPFERRGGAPQPSPRRRHDGHAPGEWGRALVRRGRRDAPVVVPAG